MYRSSYIVNPCRSGERRLQHTEGEEENGPDDEVCANAGNESASFCFDGCGDDYRMGFEPRTIYRFHSNALRVVERLMRAEKNS